MIHEISVSSRKRIEMIDITSVVQKMVSSSKVENGTCNLFVPHTTAAITINEAADPSVASDISEALSKLVPEGRGYRHTEGNADSHIKSTLVGVSQQVFIKNGRLVLGTWQGIFFCEFDGPRNRRILARIIPDR
ncbi:MAG: secondary thiamine-phosphate synthase enzyme YjbQ [Acidobacteriota bacterium]